MYQSHLYRRAKYVLLLLAAVSFTATAWAQDERISFKAPRATIGEIVSEIESQTVYSVAFDGTRLDMGIVVSLDDTNLPLNLLLDKMVAGHGLQYRIMKRYIVVVEKAPVKSAQKTSVSDIAATGDRYVRTDMSRLDAGPRRRSLPAPVITIADTTVVAADPKPVEEIPAFTSNVIAAESYTAKKLPVVGLKINLLYAAAMLTPNLAVEVGVGKRSTLELSGSWNQWRYRGNADSNRKLNHYIVRPEYRYWFCERFTGHFIGADMFFGQFNVSEYDIPLINFKKDHRYEGRVWGGGIVYGYHLPMSKHWSAEFHVGIGAAQFKYKKSDCTVCSYSDEKFTKTYFGPTRAGVSLVFMIR